MNLLERLWHWLTRPETCRYCGANLFYYNQDKRAFCSRCEEEN